MSLLKENDDKHNQVLPTGDMKIVGSNMIQTGEFLNLIQHNRDLHTTNHAATSVKYHQIKIIPMDLSLIYVEKIFNSAYSKNSELLCAA